MPRSSSVAFRNDQLNGVNQSSSEPVGLTLMKLFPKFRACRVAVEGTVSGQRVQVAGRIRRQAPARLPDAAQTAVGRRVVDHDLLQRRGIVAEDPAVVRTLIAIRRPRDVHRAVIDQEAGALILRARVECDVVLRVAAVSGAEDARLNDERTAEPLAAVADVDGMEPLDERAALLRSRDEVHGLRHGVDGRAFRRCRCCRRNRRTSRRPDRRRFATRERYRPPGSCSWCARAAPTRRGRRRRTRRRCRCWWRRRRRCGCQRPEYSRRPRTSGCA